MKMHSPPHPGEILKELYIKPLNLKQKDVSVGLSITKKALSELINGHTGISTAMSLKLAEAFDTTPESWLNLQNQFDLFHANKKSVTKNISHYYSNSQQIFAS